MKSGLRRNEHRAKWKSLLVNTTGELRYFYEHATAVFVGKSLTAEGGQNPIEPGALGKPMVFGPNMQNFAAISKLLVERDGAIQVQDATELERALEKILSDRQHATTLGENALDRRERKSGRHRAHGGNDSHGAAKPCREKIRVPCQASAMPGAMSASSEVGSQSHRAISVRQECRSWPRCPCTDCVRRRAT